MRQARVWRHGLVALALGSAAALMGCVQSSAPPPSSSSLDCLLGPDTARPECTNLDDDPEQCIQAGGLFDAETQRCIR